MINSESLHPERYSFDEGNWESSSLIAKALAEDPAKLPPASLETTSSRALRLSKDHMFILLLLAYCVSA
jgi:hypothetical protein